MRFGYEITTTKFHKHCDMGYLVCAPILFMYIQKRKYQHSLNKNSICFSIRFRMMIQVKFCLMHTSFIYLFICWFFRLLCVCVSIISTTSLREYTDKQQQQLMVNRIICLFANRIYRIQESRSTWFCLSVFFGQRDHNMIHFMEHINFLYKIH